MKISFIFLFSIWGICLSAEDVVNQWNKIKVDLKAVENLPEGEIRFSDSDGFSDSLYDSNTNEILIKTNISVKNENIDPGFYTNCTVAYSPKTNQLRLIEYSKWSGGSYGTGKIPENFSENLSPTPRHTYDGMAFDKKAHTMYMMLGANIRMYKNANGPMNETSEKAYKDDNNGLWKCDLKSGKWELIPDNIRQFWKSVYQVGPYETHLHHWEKENKLIFICSNSRYAAFFDIASGKWEQVPLKNGNKVTMSSRSVWDTKRDLWIFRSSNRLCSFDPTTMSFTDLPNPYESELHQNLDEKQQKAAKGLKSVCYLPKEDGYLITGMNGKETFYFDIEKQTWHQLDCGEIPLHRGYLNYDEATAKIILNYHYHLYELKLDLSKALTK